MKSRVSTACASKIDCPPLPQCPRNTSIVVLHVGSAQIGRYSTHMVSVALFGSTVSCFHWSVLPDRKPYFAIIELPFCSPLRAAHPSNALICDGLPQAIPSYA